MRIKLVFIFTKFSLPEVVTNDKNSCQFHDFFKVSLNFFPPRLFDYYSIVEYGAINITGLRLVKTDSSYARNFLDHWSNLDRSKYQSAGNQGITATGALAYDAVTVLEAGFRNLLQVRRIK